MPLTVLRTTATAQRLGDILDLELGQNEQEAAIRGPQMPADIYSICRTGMGGKKEKRVKGEGGKVTQG